MSFTGDDLLAICYMNDMRKKENRSNCLETLPRTISQTNSLFRQSQHKRNIRDNNKRYC